MATERVVIQVDLQGAAQAKRELTNLKSESKGVAGAVTTLKDSLRQTTGPMEAVSASTRKARTDLSAVANVVSSASAELRGILNAGQTAAQGLKATSDAAAKTQEGLNKAATGGRRARDELKRIPIHHVHGSLGTIPDVPYQVDVSSDTLFSISQNINIIHEINDSESGFCNEEYRLASRCINEAEKLIFLGFGFHYDNVRRLCVDWSSKDGKNVYSTFAETSDAEYSEIIDRLSNLGISRNVLPFRHRWGCEWLFPHATSLD